MFLLVSVCHVGAYPGEHQHGVSKQISISLGKTFLRISRIRNIPLTWILARVFVYVSPFISQILDFIYWTVLIFFGSILNGVTLKTSNTSPTYVTLLKEGLPSYKSVLVVHSWQHEQAARDLCIKSLYFSGRVPRFYGGRVAKRVTWLGNSSFG